MRHWVSAALACSVAAGAFVSGAQQAPVFRSGADVIEVIAYAADRRGAPVRDLSRADFVVEEDGVPQDITQFSLVDIPRGASKPSSNATGPAGQAGPSALQGDRSYILLLDARHVDPLRSGNVRRQAKRFVDKYVEPGDTAAVVTLGGTSYQGFTSDKKLLEKVIDTFIGGKARSATLNKLESQMRNAGDGAPRDYENAVKASDARSLFDALRQLCDNFGVSQGRRRSVLVFSEGIEMDLTDMIGPSPSSGGAEAVASSLPSTYAAELLVAQRTMLDAARRSNVSLYTIDPRGTSVGEDTLMQASSQPPAGRGVPTPPPPTVEVEREVQRSQGVLRLFAEQTGGFAVVNTSDFDRGFGRIADANSVYYVIGYSSTNTAANGKFRRIKVRVVRQGIEVTARPGYYAADPVRR